MQLVKVGTGSNVELQESPTAPCQPERQQEEVFKSLKPINE
jgi:hypothetical protein